MLSSDGKVHVKSYLSLSVMGLCLLSVKVNDGINPWNGGARRDRTADLYNAIVALSQLSYGPALYASRAY